MPKDHYVAQTYLKHFQNKKRPGYINVFWKKTGSYKRDVPINTICFKNDWSTILSEQGDVRDVEEYLKLFEPRWSECVAVLEREEFTSDAKYFMAGYMAFLRAYTPGSVRVSRTGLEEIVKSTYDLVEKKELADNNSEHMEAIRIIKEGGGVKIGVQEHYVKALLAAGMIDLHEKLRLFPWNILINETGMPFLTSDNPFCLEHISTNSTLLYLPVTPNIAILVRPIPLEINELRTKTYPSQLSTINEKGVHKLNKLLVSRAENTILSNKCSFRIKKLVRKYKKRMPEMITTKIGPYIINQDRIARKQPSSL